MDEIKSVDVTKADMSFYQKHLADCVILTHDNKLYMQRRPENWGKFAGVVNTFGGHVEAGETPMQAIIRELNEETGALVREKDLLFIGAITEDWTDHKELVHVYFWHDKDKTITGCYEAEPITFDTAEEAMAHPRIMGYAKWALAECEKRGLIPSPDQNPARRRKPAKPLAAIAFLAAFMLAACSFTREPQMKPDFDQALKSHLEAISRRDIEAFKSRLTGAKTLYTIVQNGHAFTTPEELISVHEEWFKDPDWIWEGAVVHKVEGEDMAMAVIKYSYRARAAETPFETWLTYVFRLENGEWKIIHDQNTALDFPAFAKSMKRTAE